MEQRRHYHILYGLLCLIGLLVFSPLLTGCDAARSTTTSLTIDENGRVTEEIVEKQGKEDYTQEELTAYIEQELELYNRGKEGAIQLNSCTVLNGDVKISLSYASCADYAAFNQVTCFLGTLQEAEDAGYEVERTWLDESGAAGDMALIRERFREWKVFIVSEELNLKVPDKILYASDNVRITGRLTAVVQTVMNDSQTDPAGAASGEQAVKTQVTTHPLATVADRYAYVIYK